MSSPTPAVPNPIDVQRATVGNVTIVHIPGVPTSDLFIFSSDPLTKAFRVFVRTDQNGVQLDIPVKTPNEVTHSWYKLAGKVQHITVEELQTVNSDAFTAINGRIGA
jgi:Flp pilus assembly secretin CpaC